MTSGSQVVTSPGFYSIMDSITVRRDVGRTVAEREGTEPQGRNTNLGTVSKDGVETPDWTSIPK